MMRYILLASLITVAAPTIYVMSYLAYVWWWPTSCQLPGQTVLRIHQPLYAIQDIERHCNRFDGGTQKLVAVDDKTGKEYTIIEWYNLTDSYDIFERDGYIHIIIVDDTQVISKIDSTPDFKIIYHWIDMNKQSKAREYYWWLDSPGAPEARAWALEHSYIR